MSARTLNTTAATLTSALVDLVTLADAELRKPSPARATLQHLLATATGLREDLRLLRVELDAEDVEASDLLDDAQNTLSLWTWERFLRYALVQASGVLTRLEKALASLADGDGRLVHVVRSGETLQTIAARYLGGWGEWWRLVAANNLSTAVVEVGTKLVIPEK